LRFAFVCLVIFAAAWHTPAAAGDYAWRLPRGFPIPAVPADNPMNEAKVALGARLFFAPQLSATGRHSCASCHHPDKAFTDARAVAVGATGDFLPHSAMSLANVAYNASYGWRRPDVRSLEHQMLEPLLSEHPLELGAKGREAEILRNLATDESYLAAFKASYPEEEAPLTFDNVVKAIAAFERTLLSGDSSFDRYVFGGEHDALSAEARRGMTLFFASRSGCAACHAGFNFSGNWVDADGATGAPSFADNGTGIRLRVPTLRNIAVTAPYMHDGRLQTLDAVLEHYAQAGSMPGRDERLRASHLTTAERRELLAFLESLTDRAFLARYPPPVAE
jgi:cytochrome c peroxidase